MARHYFDELENKAWVDYSYRVDGNTVYFTVDDVDDNNSAASTDPNLYEIQWQGGLEVWDNEGYNNSYPSIGEEISFTGSGDSITIVTEVCFDCWSHDDVEAGASSPTESKYVRFSVPIALEGGSGGDSGGDDSGGGDEEDTSLHGTITFVGDGDNLSDRPTTVTAVHMSTGSDYETVSFDVTGTSFEYSYGSGYGIGGTYDDGLRFNNIAKYNLTTEPANDTYCNEKNVTYTYTGSYTTRVMMVEGQLSDESSPPTFITVNVTNSNNGETTSVKIPGSFDGTYWTGETTLTSDSPLEVYNVTSDDISFIDYSYEFDESSGNTTSISVYGQISKTAADEEPEEEKQTVTVTVVGSSGSCEVVVKDEDGSYHTFSNNGTYTYQGLGVVALASAYDFGYEASGSIDLSDPFNIVVTFVSPGATYTININIDFSYITFDDSTVISYQMNGVTNDYYCADDIFDLSTDYSNSFDNIQLSSDYELVITGYPDGITPVIDKTVNGTTINYLITWDDGSTPDEPDEPDTPTEENITYIYTNGTWRATVTYLYTNGAWKEVIPNILGTTSTPSMEEETNEHGTTAVLNSYTTESNESGTTVIID